MMAFSANAIRSVRRWFSVSVGVGPHPQSAIHHEYCLPLLSLQFERNRSLSAAG
jgi:hypothetical protein